jgi:hypothetical protein
LYKEDSTRNKSEAGKNQRFMNTKVGSARITDFKTNEPFNVSVSADYPRTFGNNMAIGTEVVNHFQRYEHYVNYRTQTKDANDGTVSYVYAMGVTEKTARDMDERKGKNRSNGWEGAFIRAQGNPQKTMDLQGAFMVEYFKDLPKYVAQAGVTMPTSKAYPPALLPSFMLVTDARWHGGGGGASGMAKAMTASSYKEGRRRMQRLAIYNRETRGSPRNLWMERSLEQHYKVRGLL